VRGSGLLCRIAAWSAALAHACRGHRRPVSGLTRGRRLPGLLPCSDTQDANAGPSGESGQAIVETAISLVLTITLAFWLFELSMMAYTCIVLNDAVHEGVRYATLHGTDSSACSGPDATCTDHSPYPNVQGTVRGFTDYSLHNMTGMNIKVNYPDSTAKPGSRVTVVIEYTYAPYINFPGLKAFLTFNSLGRITY
jgi:TadE-like protein